VSHFTALYDACVLYPATLRDFLMSLAETSLFRARWTDRIHEEWITNLLAQRQDLTRERLMRTRQLMDRTVPDCLISGYEDLIPVLELPDEKDRHVLAAAIRGGADVIVTTNLRHFPVETLARYDIEPQHPDTFADHLFNLNQGTVCAAAKRHRARLKKPPLNTRQYLDSLNSAGLTRTATELGEFADLL
jgi:hypothetical protein